MAVADCLASCTTPIEAAYFGSCIKNPTDEMRTPLCFLCAWYLLFSLFQNIICMTLMTFDRWMSIEFPFSYLSKMNKRVRKRLIVASWICGGFAASISVVAKKNPMVCPFEESEPTLFIIPTLALSLSSTVFWYGRIATIALQTKASRRKQTKFRLAKTMSNFIILLSWNWELSKKYAILFQYSLFNSFCQLFHLNNNTK